jgi:hypothetical protein
MRAPPQGGGGEVEGDRRSNDNGKVAGDRESAVRGRAAKKWWHAVVLKR